MGLLSLFKNLSLGVGMPHMPTSTTSVGTMDAKEYKDVEHVNKMPLSGDHHEITGVEKDTRVRSDETGSCTFGMDQKINHPSRKKNVEGKLEKAASGQRRLAKFKGDQRLGQNASSENVGQIECKLNFLGLPIRLGEKKCHFYMRTGGCKFASRCRFHHPDPTVVGDSLLDRKNGVPSQHHVPVEQLCETPRPSEKTSNEQTAFLDPFTSNRGLQQIVHWNENQAVANLLHPPEIQKIVQLQTLADKVAADEFSGGEQQQFDDYPQRPCEPECQYFMKTGYCKFKSACRYHHPKLNLSSLSLPLRPASNDYEKHGPVEQLCEIPLPSENRSNDQIAILCPSSSNALDLFTPNWGLQPNVQWDGDQMATSTLHPPEIKMNEQGQQLANKVTAYEFNGGVKSQQFDEYPQRPGEPECQFYMKTGYCKFKSACRCHHPKSNLSFPAPLPKPDKPICTRYSRRGICKFGSTCRYKHHMEHT